MRIASEGVCLLCPLRCVVTSKEVTDHKWAAIRSLDFHFVLRWRSTAFSVRAFAAAFDAFIALARRSSGLIFSARACPPMRPRMLIASDTRLILRLLVMYVLGIFLVMRELFSVRHGEPSTNTGQYNIFVLTTNHIRRTHEEK
jgi:hypothetical protein